MMDLRYDRFCGGIERLTSETLSYVDMLRPKERCGSRRKTMWEVKGQDRTGKPRKTVEFIMAKLQTFTTSVTPGSFLFSQL